MRRLLALIALIAAAASTPAAASLTAADLARVGVKTPPDAHLPPDVRLTDDAGRPDTLGAGLGGRPGLLVFADYRCTTLCGPALSILAAGVRASGLTPGRDMTLAVVGLDPAGSPADAHAFREARLSGDPALERTSRFYIADAAAIARLTRAAGYGYIRDPEAKQYVHPVAAFVLSPDGAVSSVLSEIGMGGPAVARAVAAAKSERTLNLIDRLSLICHGLTPLTGAYDGGAMLALRIASLLTLIGAAILGVRAWRRRRAA